MRYEGTLYRPPSEADSLILQATLGCSYNRCTYCAMYRDKRFRPRDPGALREDMDLALAMYGPRGVRRVFLADGDALILRTDRLLAILGELRERFPELHRVSVYASPQSLLAKSVPDLRALVDAGLSLFYLGPETGHPVVLERIAKGVTREELLDGAGRVHAAGGKLSVMLLLGVGGRDLSEAHAVASGTLVTAMQPRFVSTLTVTPVPGTPFHDDVHAGRIVLPDDRGLLREQRIMIAHMDCRAVYRGNHASNMLPIGGTLPVDKERLLALLDVAASDASFPLRPRTTPDRL